MEWYHGSIPLLILVSQTNALLNANENKKEGKLGTSLFIFPLGYGTLCKEIMTPLMSLSIPICGAFPRHSIKIYFEAILFR